MKHIKKLSNYATGVGLGLLLASGLTACQDRKAEEQTNNLEPQKKNAFVVIEEVKPGHYKIAEEFPAKETRIVLKRLDGTEKVLTKEEMDALIKKEEAKIDNGTSPLTSPNGAEVAKEGGLSLGEAILASAAGAMIGSWLGNKLFNNPNYQQTRRSSYKNPSTYNRSVNSFKKGSRTTSRTSSTRRSGFFGSSRSRSSGARSGFFGG